MGLLKSILPVCCVLAVTAGCRKSVKVSSGSSDKKPDVVTHELTHTRNYENEPAKFDVCALLTKQEVQTVVGSTITQSSGSGRSDGNLRISQCVYVASRAEQSVSLVLTDTDPVGRNKRRAKDLWRERFDRFQKQSKEDGEERDGSERNLSESEEEAREGLPPRRIEHLGDEAYWTAGSLYVLHNESFLRLSIGGSSSEETKLEHSKALAEIALKRF